MVSMENRSSGMASGCRRPGGGLICRFHQLTGVTGPDVLLYIGSEAGPPVVSSDARFDGRDPAMAHGGDVVVLAEDHRSFVLRDEEAWAAVLVGVIPHAVDLEGFGVGFDLVE